jgi:N-acyl-D-amino-acid deacylase
MHLRDRGRVAPGRTADLVAFDPARVVDEATFADPLKLSRGIEHVVVGGTTVLASGRMTGARPGRTVRKHG